MRAAQLWPDPGDNLQSIFWGRNLLKNAKCTRGQRPSSFTYVKSQNVYRAIYTRIVPSVDTRDRSMTKQIFCLSAPAPVTTPTATGYTATETHTLATAAARIGVPKSTIHRWVVSGDLPSTPHYGRYIFQSHHLDQFALRVKCESFKKLQQAKQQTTLSSVLANPSGANDGALISAYLTSSGSTASSLWPEVSRRYRANPHAVGQMIASATAQNAAAAKAAPQFANLYNRSTRRTERTRIR